MSEIPRNNCDSIWPSAVDIALGGDGTTDLLGTKYRYIVGLASRTLAEQHNPLKPLSDDSLLKILAIKPAEADFFVRGQFNHVLSIDSPNILLVSSGMDQYIWVLTFHKNESDSSPYLCALGRDPEDLSKECVDGFSKIRVIFNVRSIY